MSQPLPPSPARDPSPMYAKSNSQATSTPPPPCLSSRRFEKLQKWMIGHFRSLKDRMNDIERWRIKKQKETRKPAGLSVIPDTHVHKEEMRQLGREVAKMATAHSNLSSGPRSQTALVSMAPRQTSTQLVPKTADPPSVLYLSHTASYRYSGTFQEIFTTLDTISPPLASSNRRQSRTQLLYPTVYRVLKLPETPSRLQDHCEGLSVPSNRTTRIESPSSLFASQNRWTIASAGKLWTSANSKQREAWNKA
jgi:hypothetical protein